MSARDERWESSFSIMHERPHSVLLNRSKPTKFLLLTHTMAMDGAGFASPHRRCGRALGDHAERQGPSSLHPVVHSGPHWSQLESSISWPTQSTSTLLSQAVFRLLVKCTLTALTSIAFLRIWHCSSFYVHFCCQACRLLVVIHQHFAFLLGGQTGLWVSPGTFKVCFILCILSCMTHLTADNGLRLITSRMLTVSSRPWTTGSAKLCCAANRRASAACCL